MCTLTLCNRAAPVHFYAFSRILRVSEEEENNSLTGSDVALTRAWASARYLVSGAGLYIIP